MYVRRGVKFDVLTSIGCGCGLNYESANVLRGDCGNGNRSARKTLRILRSKNKKRVEKAPGSKSVIRLNCQRVGLQLFSLVMYKSLKKLSIEIKHLAVTKAQRLYTPKSRSN